MGNDPKSIKSLRAYYKSGDILGANDLLESIKEESDRAAVIIIAAYIEDVLLDIIVTRGRKKKTSEQIEHLSRRDGPLGSFSSRIDMAHMLGIYDDRMQNLLHLIREMRNACAHSRRAISFSTPEVKAVVRRMLTDLPLTLTPKGESGSGEVYRGVFMMVTLTVVAALLKPLEDHYTRLVQLPSSPGKPLPQPTSADRSSRKARKPQHPPTASLESDHPLAASRKKSVKRQASD